MRMAGWKELWKQTTDPFERFDIWAAHWVQVHPEDADADIFDLIEKYATDPDLRGEGKKRGEVIHG
jgi:hypothetical protein